MIAAATPSVLCIDDDAAILEWMKTTLGGRGYRVATQEAGSGALRSVEQAKPDVILLDVNMPGMNGYEVCARLQEKEETSCIPVIFVTGMDGEQDQARALRAGAADFLTKPIDEKRLCSAVESHLATRSRWKDLHAGVRPPKSDPLPTARWDAKLRPTEFARFKQALARKFSLPAEAAEALQRASSRELYPAAAALSLTGRQVCEAMAEFLSLPYSEELPAKSVKLGVLPAAFCKTHQIVPMTVNDLSLSFVLSNPFPWDVQEAIQRAGERKQSPMLILTAPENVALLLDPVAPAARKKPALSEIEARLHAEYGSGDADEAVDPNALEPSAPVIQLINNLIDTAYLRGASDIHIEPWEDELIVRYRVDGDMAVVNRLKPARLINPMVAVLKILANLDISERRLPQDGRIKFKQHTATGKDFDLRVATAPMNFGEKVVLRILDKEKSVLPLADLGFAPRNLATYREKIASPHGMILHVGPTGSGKSMTLYAALNEIKNPSINVQTAEDPIEYTLPGINQLQVRKEIGLTFGRALRSFLRLDPDVILVGEIRDRETAEMAVEASLTGHLLLSTLHTNDAASTVTRFLEMGIEPYMVSSSLLVICAQRLLRRLCRECRQPYAPDALQRGLAGIPGAQATTLYRAKGCEKCGGMGYRGRIGIHEVLAPDEALRAAINQEGITAEALKRMAVDRLGMTTLYWDAMDKVRAGVTSLEDALANVRQDEFDSRPKWMKEAR